MENNRPIPVLHVITSLNVGGAERAITSLLTRQEDDEYYSVVLCLRGQGRFVRELENSGIEVYCWGLSIRSMSIVTIFKSIRRLFQIKPKIINGWMYHGNLIAFFIKLIFFRASTLVWNVRHSLIDIQLEKISTKYVIWLNKLLSRPVDKIIYNSEVSRDQHRSYGFYSLKDIVIYNGFDTEKLKYSLSAREKSRKRLGLNSEQVVIGHVARFHSMKDHELFFSSAREVIKKNPNTVFVAAGRNVVPENPAFPAWIRSAEYQSSFLLLGESDSVYDLYQAMDFLVVSSAWGEGFPNVLGEAMSFSVPCITTDVGDSAVVVAETGRVIQPRDESSMVNAMISFVCMSTEERVYLGEKARNQIVNNFSAQLMKQGYDNLYHSLVT